MAKLLLSSLALLTLGLLSANGFRHNFNFTGVDPSVFDGPQKPRAGPLEDPLTTIKNGTLKGVIKTGLGTDMYVYQSVPYAAPPLGDLRFKAPQPFMDAWGDEVRDATKLPNTCAQGGPILKPASEDCLYMNIHTTASPAEATTAKLPVMFFIHGGGFASGEIGYYGGAKLTIKPSVVITIQYRLGAFGFFSTADAESPGNYGLKDMVQALRWVKENVAAFGGDPDNVTILGESAGGASVTFMLLSEMARGLFHKAIAQSGSAISPWAVDRKPLECAHKMAQELGCPTTNSKDLMTCMREVSMEEIIRVTDEFGGAAYAALDLGLGCTTPTIEPDLPGAFITQEPMEILRNGQVTDVPLMLGTTLHEGSYVLGELFLAYLKPTDNYNDPEWMRDELIPAMLNVFGIDEREGPGAISESVSLAFMPGSTRENFTENMPNIVDMMSVFFMKASCLRTADILSRRFKSPVYLYSVEQLSINSMWNLLFIGHIMPIKHGVTHADDLMYIFYLPMIATADDTKFSKQMSTIWNDFATTGNPTPEASTDYPNWPSYNVTTQHFMRLSTKSKVAQDFVTSWTPRGFTAPPEEE